MRHRCVAAIAMAFVAAAASADEAAPAAPPAEPKVTPGAKAALERMERLIDRPVDKGLKVMAGTVEVASPQGRVTVQVSFSAPATFKAETSGGSDLSTAAVLQAAMNGVRPVDGPPVDAETVRRDGRDVLVLTAHPAGGGTSRVEYTIDADGLPVSARHHRRRTVDGVERDDDATVVRTWAKAGEKHRLAKLETTADGTGTATTTLAYEEFDGIPIVTSWRTVSAPPGQTLECRFTELTLNGKKAELKGAKAGGAAAPVSTPISPAVPIAVTGTYVHEASGLSFPKTAARFFRIAANRYDREGNDVGIGYRRMWKDVHAEVTVFVFPVARRPDGTAMAFDEQFDREVAEVRNGHEDVKEVGRTDASATFAGRTIATRTAEFRFRGEGPFGERAVASFLTGFRTPPWHVKYRVTATLERREDALAAVEELLAELHLPSTGLPVPKASEKR